MSRQSKQAAAAKLRVSRSMLYYHPKLPEKDWLLKNRIEKVWRGHPSYGHKRLAIELNANKKRIRRVMKLFGLKPYRRRTKKPFKKADINQEASGYLNLLQLINFPNKPNIAWVSDFTYIRFKGRFVYLATILDLFSREIVGWSVSTAHNTQLVLLALIDALDKHHTPQILHSDQGSEYKAKSYTSFAEILGIKISMSHKGCPWENGYQESFYSQFKVDLGDPSRFDCLGELTAAIYMQIWIYNHSRIHTKLKMPPKLYAAQRPLLTPQSLTAYTIDKVS